MTASSSAPTSRRERLWLAAASLAPFAVFAIARYFGYVKYLGLAGMALAAVAGATVLFLRPRWGLYFIIFYVYAGLGMYFPINAAGPLTFLVLAAVLLGLLRGDANLLEDPLFWYANAFFVLLSLQSMVFALDPALSFKELATYGKMVLVTWLIVQLVRTPNDLRFLAYAVFAGAVATVFLGLANMALGISVPGENYIGDGAYIVRFTGAHENPNRAAAFMCSALPLGLFGVKYSSRGLPRILFVSGVVVLIVAIFATFSRSVVVPFAFITLGVVVREVRGRRSTIALVALLALGILLGPRYYWERVLALKDAFQTVALDWSVFTRMMALRTAWELFLAHPLTGIGLGNFIVAGAYEVFIRVVVHNSYLEILVGTGVFGLLAYLMVLFSGIRHTVSGARRRWERHPEWMRSLSFYFALSALSIFLSAFFGTMPFRYPIWVPVAAGLVVARLMRQDLPAGTSPAR